MDKGYVSIPTLGLHHFCIKNKNPVDALKHKYSIQNLSDVQRVNKIDWGFIFGVDDDSKNFILLTDLNDWSYFIWKYWDFNTNLEFAKELSEILQTTVNYYFVDSHIATSRWIFAREGLIVRAYYESHGQKLFDKGFNPAEKDLRMNIEEVFVEDIFWDLYERTCVSLEYVNRQNRTELKLYTGTLDDSKNNS